MSSYFALLDLGAPQLLIIFAIVFLLFGSKKLPELSRSLGKSVQEFKQGAGKAGDLKRDLATQLDEVKTGLNVSDRR